MSWDLMGAIALGRGKEQHTTQVIMIYMNLKLSVDIESSRIKKAFNISDFLKIVGFITNKKFWLEKDKAWTRTGAEHGSEFEVKVECLT